jgi:hypothetical protein
VVSTKTNQIIFALPFPSTGGSYTINNLLVSCRNLTILLFVTLSELKITWSKNTVLEEAWERGWREHEEFFSKKISVLRLVLYFAEGNLYQI